MSQSKYRLFLKNPLIIASIDVDAQNCFTPLCPDELPIPEGHLIVEELNQMAEFAHFRLGSKDAHSEHSVWVANNDNPQFTPVSGKNVDIRWNRHAEPGTIGFELIEGLPKPCDYDYFVWKGVELDMHPYGICYHDLNQKLSTGLIEYLRQNQVNLVLLGGLATDYCVKTSALELRAANFDVIINLAATRGIAPETTHKAIQEMKTAGIEFVDSAQDFYNLCLK